MSRSISARSLVTRLSLKRRWTVDDARSVLERFTASGLTVREFAEREGVDRQRLYRWRGVRAECAAAECVEVSRARSPRPGEILLRSGNVVRRNEGFCKEALRRVVALLGGEAPAC